ncbi:MAG TPA: prepilin-type N-terminal cleavage/methylation domain-containing protein [Gemmatimonadaceae bacterium]|nr:prepilin-type N-terminal cleavage/methylation domain-containing protein [Gemmatimonadaceae bacterium]
MSSSSKQGFSLIEVLVSMSLLSVVLLSLAAGATSALTHMHKAKQDVAYAADVQQVADSLVSAGWKNVLPGSGALRGRAISWDVLDVNSNSQQVNIVVDRRGQANTRIVYADTVALFLANPQVQ